MYESNAQAPEPLATPVEGAVFIVIVVGTVAASTATNVAAPIIALIGVVSATLIAAHTAHRRQLRELAAQHVRLIETLAAERERLMMRLAHERELEHQSDLGGVLDAAGHELRRVERLSVDALSGTITPGVEHVADRRQALDDIRGSLARRVNPTDEMILAIADAIEALSVLESCVRNGTDAHGSWIALAVSLQDFNEAVAERLSPVSAGDGLREGDEDDEPLERSGRLVAHQPSRAIAAPSRAPSP